MLNYLISIFPALILYGIIVALSFLKLGTNIVQRFWKSKSWTNHTSRTMDFCELLKFYSCFIPSTMALALVLYFYNVNYIQCPTTFYKYQFKYCECDLVERNYHIQDQPSEFELNNFCNERYNTENIFYLNTTILFSQYLPETYNAGQKGINNQTFFMQMVNNVELPLSYFRPLCDDDIW